MGYAGCEACEGPLFRVEWEEWEYSENEGQMGRITRRTWITCGLTTLAMAGCRPSIDSSTDERIAVAVSIPPHAWLVEQIGGEHVRVQTIVKPGESPETFQPDDHQITQILRCEYYFLCGFPFEYGRSLSAIRSVERLKRIDLRDELPLMTSLHDHTDHDHADHDHADHESETRGEGNDPYAGTDFHIWLSVPLVKLQAQRIAAELSEARPSFRADFERRLQALISELDALDTEIRAILEPYRDRSFLVVHPAWGYFAADYGLHQLAMHHDGKQPSDSEMTELQRQVSLSRIRTVFVQEESGLRTATTLAESLGCHAVVLPVLAPQISDTLRTTAQKLAASFRENE